MLANILGLWREDSLGMELAHKKDNTKLGVLKNYGYYDRDVLYDR